MNDIDSYRRVQRQLARARYMGLDPQISQGSIALNNGASRFDSTQELENWLDGYSYALQHGKAPGDRIETHVAGITTVENLRKGGSLVLDLTPHELDGMNPNQLQDMLRSEAFRIIAKDVE